jgi:HlyD family secretion protein
VKGQTAAALQQITDASKSMDEARVRLYYFSTPSSLTGLEMLDTLKQADEDLVKARAAYDSCKDASRQRSDCIEKRKDLEIAQNAYNAMVRRVGYEATVLSAEDKLAKAKADYGKFSAASDDSAVLPNEMVITAPFDGIVAALHFNEQEWVNPGEAVIELQDVSRWRVETKNVSELQIGRIAIGQEVNATVNAFRNDILTGRVLEIHPDAVVQQGDVTYTLIIELEATDLNLRPGMTVQVTISTE